MKNFIKQYKAVIILAVSLGSSVMVTKGCVQKTDAEIIQMATKAALEAAEQSGVE